VRFSEQEFKYFKSIVKLRQKDLIKILSKYLKRIYGNNNVISTTQYICASGTIPVCLVAHLDTVHTMKPHGIFFDREEDVIWSPQGLGADDRAGVYAILKIIESGLRPHVIFTTDEETGGEGAIKITNDFLSCPFKDIRYFIELDRCGKEDCVFYSCDNQSFIEYIESFGFSTALGTFTDIVFLTEAWGIAGVNLSIGYYYEHTKTELLHSTYLLDTIDKVKEMLTQENKNIPTFVFVPKENYLDFPTGFASKCYACDTFVPKEEIVSTLVEVETNRFEMVPLCIDCLEEYANWCKYCGQPFVIKNKKTVYCPACQKKEFREL